MNSSSRSGNGPSLSAVLSGGGGGGGSSTPPVVVHPLLALGGGSGTGGGSGRSRGYAALESIVSAMGSSGGGHHSLLGASSSGSISQAQLTARRRPLNPFVSDRRWGTDVGEVEIVGSRISSFMEAFMGSSNVVEMQKNEITTEEANAKIEKKEHESELEKDIRKMKSEMEQAYQSKGTSSESSRVFSSEDVEETKDEREEDMVESKEGDPNDLLGVNTSRGNSASSPDVTSSSSASLSSSSICLPDVVQVSSGSARSASSTISLDVGLVAQQLSSVSNEDGGITDGTNVTIDSTSELSTLVDRNDGGNAMEVELESPTTSVLVDGGSSTENVQQPQADLDEFCPPGFDQEVWNSLPGDMRNEMLADMGLLPSTNSAGQQSQGSGLLTSTSLDRDALAELPATLREEILQEEASERRRRQSIDESLTSNATLTAEGEQGRAPEPESNASFLASLGPDLRMEVLLSADAAFLASLPEATQTEARNLQAQHGMVGGLAAAQMRMFNESSGRSGGSGSRTGESHGEGEGGERPHTRSDSSRQLLTTTSEPPPEKQTLTAAEKEAQDAAEEALAFKKRSTLKLTGNRIPPVPFSRRLAVRLILQLYSSKRAKLSKPLLKLLVCVCRYQLVRKWVVAAIVALMYNDTNQLWTALQKLTNHDLRTGLSVDGVRREKGVLSDLPAKGVLVAATSLSTSEASHLEDFATLLNSISMLDVPTQCFSSAKDGDSNGLLVPTPVTLRRLLHALNYLCRKTERLVWYDIMLPSSTPSRSSLVDRSGCGSLIDAECDGNWMFGRLMRMLLHPVLASSGANTDHVLHLLEDLLTPLNKLTIADANALVAKQRHQSSSSSTTMDSPSTKREAKRVRIAVDDISSTSDGGRGGTEVPFTSTINTNSGQRSSTIGGSSSSSDMSNVLNVGKGSRGSKLTKSSFGNASDVVDIPFPHLSDSHSKILASIVQIKDSGGVFRSRLSRILRLLSLHDGNWHQLLHHLSTVAENVAREAIREARAVQLLLLEVIQEGGTASAALALPQLSSPSSVSELHLLQVLQLMTGLRSTGVTAGADQDGEDESSAATKCAKDAITEELVSSYIRRIDFQDLWDLLVGSLDLVRYLEGISDVDGEGDVDLVSGDGMVQFDTTSSVGGGSSSSSSSSSSSANPSEGKADLTNEKESLEEKKIKSQPNADAKSPAPSSLSALTMRFMPLIECFLTVCGSTVLKRDRGGKSSTVESGGNSSDSSCAKRSLDEDNSGTAVTSSPSPAISSNHSPSPGKPDLRIKDTQMPGQRFRQSAEFKLMQRDLDMDGENGSEDGRRLLVFIERNRVLLNMVLRQNVHLLEASFSPLVEIPRCRSLLHFDIKRAYFKMKLKRMKQSLMANRNSFGTLKVNVNRESLLDDSFQRLRFASTADMRRRLSVTFVGEEGIDAGGVTREWYAAISKAMFNEGYMLFINPTDDKVTFQPNPQSGVFNPHHLDYFKFIGRIIGKAICDGFLLDAHFTRSFYKHILGLSISYHDLEAIDPQYYKNMMTLLSMNHEDVQYLDLTFSAEVDLFGETTTVDLVENGRNISVTGDNILDYVQLDAHHRMTAAIRKQLDSFLEGFHDLVPPELVSIFDAQELELLISGLPTIDLEDLRAHTEYNGYKLSDPIINWFWNVLRGFSDEEKALFLQFVTGTSKVPLDGFQDLRGSRGVQIFSIHKAFGANNLPCAHTCFNQLDLPEYKSEEELKEKLTLAIREGSEGFGIA